MRRACLTALLAVALLGSALGSRSLLSGRLVVQCGASSSYDLPTGNVPNTGVRACCPLRLALKRTALGLTARCPGRTASA